MQPLFLHKKILRIAFISSWQELILEQNTARELQGTIMGDSTSRPVSRLCRHLNLVYRDDARPHRVYTYPECQLGVMKATPRITEHSLAMVGDFTVAICNPIT